MTYDSRERSADLARPVELYTFARGAQLYRYTSANAERIVEFQTFAKAPIQRTEIEQGAEINRSGLRLTVPRDFPVALLYAIAPPSDTVALTLRQYHEGDGELATIWSGRVINVSFRGSLAEINLEPIGTSLRRNGLRRFYQKTCPYVLGRNGCNVNMEGYRVPAPVDTVVGLTVTANELGAFPDGYFNGGYMEWPIGTGLYERRDIVGHVGTDVELDLIPYGLPVGIIANFFPGCDHTLGEFGCGKFDNEDNFGGMPFIPTKNPYGDEPVY